MAVRSPHDPSQICGKLCTAATNPAGALTWHNTDFSTIHSTYYLSYLYS